MKNRNTIFTTILLVLACFALSPQARAACQEGCGGFDNRNTFLGNYALINTNSFENTAIGAYAVSNNTTGNYNTATGAYALYSNTTGAVNTATGSSALISNLTGSYNTATGYQALEGNKTGFDNTADGVQALYSNTTGYGNTATGFKALFSNTTISGVSGSNNTATGVFALQNNTTGKTNTATGVDALILNTTGNFNTANGEGALLSNTTGSSNTATGVDALYKNTGNNNIAIGVSAGANLTTGSNNIDIGALGTAGESSTIRIGTVGTHMKAFIAGISVSAISGTAVVVNSNGRLGVAASSARFKDAIKPMDKASEAILALKPVTFHCKKELDPDGIAQFGLIAEQVEKANPDLVARDADGKAYTVRYEAVNAMLLNEFLKEHRKVQEQEATLTQLKKDLQSKFAEQQKQIKALASGLEKVTAQIDKGEPAPQIVLNER